MNINRSGRLFLLTGNTWVAGIQFCNDFSGRFNYVLKKRNKKLRLNWFGYKRFKTKKVYEVSEIHKRIDHRTTKLIWFPFVFIRYSRNDLREDIFVTIED